MRNHALGVMAVGLLATLQIRPVPVLHVVQVGTVAGGNRFDPIETVARIGDTVRFNNFGGIHNVQFEADSMSDSARGLLSAVMLGEKIAPLSSPLLLDSKEHYEFVVPPLPPARYPFVCLPHAASGMKGVLVVVP
jgi:plastocyanin